MSRIHLRVSLMMSIEVDCVDLASCQGRMMMIRTGDWCRVGLVLRRGLDVFFSGIGSALVGTSGGWSGPGSGMKSSI